MKDIDLIKKYVDPKKQKKALELYEKNYPLQYIIGNVEFYGYKFIVNKNVLIPRFETEYLVEKTINYIKKLNIKNVNIADLGCGSGCIGITLKKELDSDVTLYDISRKALKVAKKNIKLNNVGVKIIKKDIRKKLNNKYNVIISNPPYIKKDGFVEEKVVKHEPKLALFAKKNGLEFYESILKNASDSLEKKYLIAFEIGYDQKESVINIAKKYLKNCNVIAEQDLTGKDRYIFIMSE